MAALLWWSFSGTDEAKAPAVGHSWSTQLAFPSRVGQFARTGKNRNSIRRAEIHARRLHEVIGAIVLGIHQGPRYRSQSRCSRADRREADARWRGRKSGPR